MRKIKGEYAADPEHDLLIARAETFSGNYFCIWVTDDGSIGKTRLDDPYQLFYNWIYDAGDLLLIPEYCYIRTFKWMI